MSEELKPCPFCGTSGDNLYLAFNETYVICKVCGANGPSEDASIPSDDVDPDDAWRLWNTRSIDAELARVTVERHALLFGNEEERC